MNCLTQQQIRDFINGNKTDDQIAHLARCEGCRSLIAQMLAETNHTLPISSALEKKTVDAIISMSQKKAPLKSTGPASPVLFGGGLRYALAASVLLSVAGVSIFYGIRSQAHRVPMAGLLSKNGTTEQTTDKNPDINKSGLPPATAPHDNQASLMIFDSIVVRKGPIRISEKKESLIRIGTSAGIAAEPKTHMRLTNRSDTSLCIEMTRGNALFSIEKNRYREFLVQTPTALISVTGTVFSLQVDQNFTMLNVIEGCVRLIHQKNPAIISTVAQGNGAFVDQDSIVRVMFENSTLFKEREHLLEDYIQHTVLGSNFSGISSTPEKVKSQKQ